MPGSFLGVAATCERRNNASKTTLDIYLTFPYHDIPTTWIQAIRFGSGHLNASPTQGLADAKELRVMDDARPASNSGGYS